MVLLKKIKKINKILLSLYLLLSIGFFIGILLLTINLSFLVGIETFMRITLLAILYLILIFYLLYGFVWLFSKKTIKLIIYTIFIIIFTFATYFGSYYINKTYRIIDSINKEEITYTTNLILLNNTVFRNTKEFKVGMINNDSDIAGNVLAHEMIKKENYLFTIIDYFDYHEMLEALNDKEIDGLFIASNYESFLSEDELYSSIAESTKVYNSLSKTIKKQNTNVSASDFKKPFTILLMGIDSTSGGLNKNDAFNGDSIMLITFNPKTLSSTFLSIPRDTYVPITCNNNQENKINKSAYAGAQCMMDTITKLTGIKIDHYVKMNFTGLVDLVNAVGGVYVDVPYSFCEQDSKRRFDEHLIYLKSGYQKLNGEQALALSRNRKTHPECSKEWNLGERNDFIRGQNQQLVVQALLNQAKTIRNVDSLIKILNSISKNMDTSMQTNQILSFYETAKNLLFGMIEGNNNLLKTEKLYLQTYPLTIYKVGMAEIYQQKSLDEVIKAMKINLELISSEPIKEFSFDANTTYEIPVIGKGLFDSVRRQTVPDFKGKYKDEAINWGKQNNIVIKVKEVNNNPEIENNIILSQNIPATQITNLVNEIEITIQMSN